MQITNNNNNNLILLENIQFGTVDTVNCIIVSMVYGFKVYMQYNYMYGGSIISFT